MLNDKLAGVITTKPDVIQFAKDRKYEEAWIIKSDEKQPDTSEIQAYLIKEPFKVLIVEYIWNENDNDKRFVLTLFQDKNCQNQHPFEFMQLCLEWFYNYSGFNDLINLLDEKIIGKKDYLFNSHVEAINMGIFNHWMSVGPLDIWGEGQIFNIQDSISKIKARPEIEKSKLNYQGLLFRFNGAGKLPGPYYGLKTPCCNFDLGEWKVDFEKVKYWMEFMLEF